MFLKGFDPARVHAATLFGPQRFRVLEVRTDVPSFTHATADPPP